MKTTPMMHQLTGTARLASNDKFLLACEQGTGKTWMLLADAEQRFLRNEIDAVFVLAPKGVHTNWVRREIPAHLGVPFMAANYLAGGGKKRAAAIERLFQPDDERTLRILTMNIEAINFKEGYSLAARFLKTFRCAMVIDESSRIKNPSAERTKRAIRLGELASVKRIATGTPITNSPVDAFAQFEFLAPGLLGTTSYRAFVAEYAHILPPTHPLMTRIAAKARFAPQIVAKDRNGAPMWRNLDKLNGIMSPLMFRVLKSECLDLPEKIYQTQFFELTPAQRALYTRADEEMNLEMADGNIDTFTALTKLGKLRQITSGFVIHEGVPRLIDDNPRLEALMELIDGLEGQFIIWAHYVEEISHISAALAAANINFVEYHGSVGTKAREAAVDSFQKGEAIAFVGQPQSGGIGLTLTAATTVIYYSNDFSLEQRLQSEDRAHRIGTTEHVVYIDIAAADTIDEQIATALQMKQDVAATILGDRR
jgi:SNF2 family DNA or RNA helicase